MSKRIKIEDQGIAEQLLAAFGDGLINGIIKMKVNIIQEKGTHSPKKNKERTNCSQDFIAFITHMLDVLWQ